MIEELQSLEQQLAEVEAKRQALIAAKSAKMEEAKGTVLVEIRELMDSCGLSKNEVIAYLSPAKRAQSQPSSRSRCVYRDADGREYRGGKPPSWLTQAMAAAGVASTKDYCQQFMSRVQ